MSFSDRPKCRFIDHICNLDTPMRYEGNACVNRYCVRGKSFKDTLTSAYHLRPPIQTNYQKYLELLGEKNFRSSKYPLGERNRVNPHVPRDFDTTNTRFGVKSVRGESIWPHLRPPLSQAEVMEAAMKDKDFPGRQTKRGFNYDSNARFGVKSSSSKETVDRLLHTYFELTSARELVGLINRPEKSGDLRLDKDIAKVAHTRNHLKKVIAHNFDNAKQAFDFFDKRNRGFIDYKSLDETLRQFNIMLSSKQLELLIKECKGTNRPKVDVKNPKTYKYGKDCCTGKEKKCLIIEDEEDICETIKEVEDKKYSDDTMNFDEFVTFLTYFKKDHKTGVKFPKLIRKNLVIELPESIYKNDFIPYRKPDDETMIHGLSSAMLKEVDEKDIKKALSTDRVRYLIHPSIFDKLGINKDDWNKLRTKEHIRLIFFPYFEGDKNDENFDCLYKLASSDNNCGMASVQKFKEILDSFSYNL